MEDIKVILCSDDYLELLADMNKQLIVDEGHDNKMDMDQLKARMHDFLHSDYNAYLFEKDGQTIGYALVNMKKEPLYLRQFFICREFRKSGNGTVAFRRLLSALGTTSIDIEVLVWNKKGRRFWETLGFKPRSIYMRYGSNE